MVEMGEDRLGEGGKCGGDLWCEWDGDIVRGKDKVIDRLIKVGVILV